MNTLFYAFLIILNIIIGGFILFMYKLFGLTTYIYILIVYTILNICIGIGYSIVIKRKEITNL